MRYSYIFPRLFVQLMLLPLVLLGLLTGCGNDEEFLIKCDIKGLGNKGVEIFYADRGLHRASFHPADDKVTLRGSSQEPVFVDVFTVDGEWLFGCVARNGDDLEVKMSLADPSKIEIKGNDDSRRYAAFLSANDSILRSGDAAAVNALIAREVRANPSYISSAMLLATRFNARGYELLADSLINTLTPEARPEGVIGGFAGLVGEQLTPAVRGDVRTMTFRAAPDTVVRYVPAMQSYSLLVFVGRSKHDSIRSVLREMQSTLPKKRFTEIEMTVMSDSATWAASIRRDSAKWVQAWLSGGVAHNAVRAVQVPYVPFFIVTDSLGHQVYRGGSVCAASDTLRSRLAPYFRDETPADSIAD